MIKENYHTHTFYCDGKNSPEELIEKALELNFNILGFSGHGHTKRDSSYCMSLENTQKYIAQINILKEKYKDKILILSGIEQDIISDDGVSSFDYIIGSSHYIVRGEHFYPVDGSIKEFESLVKNVYKNSFLDFAKEYFENVSEVYNITKCHIIGHFDLISKNFERLNINESDKYLYYAEEAVKKLVKHNVPFEINSGAIARGYRTTPYPSENILKMIKNYGGKIIFNSDCHDKKYLDCYFCEAEILAKSIGFTKRCIIDEEGIREIDL